MGELRLPVIVIYPEYDDKSDIVNCKSKTITRQIKTLWDRLPAFRDAMNEVPTLHIPLKKDLIRSALNDKDWMVGSKRDAGIYFYPC